VSADGKPGDLTSGDLASGDPASGEPASRNTASPSGNADGVVKAEEVEKPEKAQGADEADGAEAVDDIEVRDPISVPDAEGNPRRATRRFPLFTRDTARPEGGGRAAPRDAPAPARQWPILAVLSTVGLGLLLTALDLFRLGILLVGVALLVGGLLRWLLPDVGMLAVRSRFTDIVTYGVLGGAIALLALMIQPHSLLKLSFLTDILHFSVTN